LPVREFVEQTAAGKLRAVAEEMKRNGVSQNRFYSEA
uniref:Radical SAM protein n=1 Tax=Heligmosomoides polygyrus TaxID=6339 RepID=A0A183FC74_HELPZ